MGLEARNRDLPEWFARIRTHQIVLPRFQRYEAWSHANVAQLFNTVLQDLPIGAVLILNIGDAEPFVSRAVAGAPETGGRVTENLLDGQQRLTALWRGLNNNYPDRTYFIRLKQDDETGTAYYVESIARWQMSNEEQRRPFWANNPKEQWAKCMVPLDLCAPGDAAVERFNSWLRAVCEDPEKRSVIQDQIWKIRQKFVAFNIPFLALPVQTKPATALDVFMKMNTSAQALSTYDIVVAQVEASLGQSLHDLVAKTKSVCPNLESYYPPEDLVLAAGALLQGRAPTNATYLPKEFGANVISNWARFDAGVTRAVPFLEEERTFDAARLPTDVVVPMMVALWADAPSGTDAEGRARLILRRYIWRAFFSKRYELATATRAIADYQELKAYIADAKAPRPAIFDDAQYPLPEQNELIAAGWPKAKDRLARAILALALRHGGMDLADGSSASRTSLARREYHHLFPAAYLKRLDVPDTRVFLSLNCALVSWRTNRAISDKQPEKYLSERRTPEDPSDTEIRDRLASHLIPYEPMKTGGYDDFLRERAMLVEAEMRKICGAKGSEN